MTKQTCTSTLGVHVYILVYVCKQTFYAYTCSATSMLFLECNFTLLGYVGQLSKLLEAA